MNEDKKTERRREIIAVCLDCFVEKGLTITTTKDLCTAAKLQNGGIYYYFSTKEEIVLACAEAAIERIEKGAFGIVFEDIQDVKSMMDRLVTNYYKDKNRINHELYSSLSSSGAIKFSESPFERPLFLFLNPHYPHRS